MMELRRERRKFMEEFADALPLRHNSNRSSSVDTVLWKEGDGLIRGVLPELSRLLIRRSCESLIEIPPVVSSGMSQGTRNIRHEAAVLVPPDMKNAVWYEPKASYIRPKNGK